MALWQRWGRDFYPDGRRGVTPGDVEALFDEISGMRLKSYFDKYIRGTEDVPLAKLLAEYLPQDQIAEVRRAYEFGAQEHKGQSRTSGEPYIFHPLAVARILAEMRMDATTLCAAILHDVIEDTGVSKDEVATRFGKDVAALVDGVSKIGKIEGMTRQERRHPDIIDGSRRRRIEPGQRIDVASPPQAQLQHQLS